MLPYQVGSCARAGPAVIRATAEAVRRAIRIPFYSLRVSDDPAGRHPPQLRSKMGMVGAAFQVVLPLWVAPLPIRHSKLSTNTVRSRPRFDTFWERLWRAPVSRCLHAIFRA